MDIKLVDATDGWLRPLVDEIIVDAELAAMQEAANHVSIVRLGYNDHGPIHMRKATIAALKIMNLLSLHGVQPSLVRENQGTVIDAQFAIIIAGMVHDVGMAVTRDRHEWHSIQISYDLVEAYLSKAYPGQKLKKAILRGMIHECIVGHMGIEKIYSIEAGCLLVGDGTDMTKGRARIARVLARSPALGDIHRHSAESITSVMVEVGKERPVCVKVKMNAVAGIFQVEEILLKKIAASPLKKYVEVVVLVNKEEPRSYLLD